MLTLRRAFVFLRRRLPELGFGLAILLFWGLRDARENALLRTSIDVSPDKEVTLLSTSW